MSAGSAAALDAPDAGVFGVTTPVGTAASVGFAAAPFAVCAGSGLIAGLGAAGFGFAGFGAAGFFVAAFGAGLDVAAMDFGAGLGFAGLGAAGFFAAFFGPALAVAPRPVGFTAGLAFGVRLIVADFGAPGAPAFGAGLLSGGGMVVSVSS